MTGNPMRPRGTSPGVRSERGAADVALVQGTFPSLRGRSGTMSGSVRLERIIDLPDATLLEVVFTGHLLDADGRPIGVGSRRQQVPAVMVGGADGAHLSVGPRQVDILGLTVNVSGFTMVTEAVWTPEGHLMSRGARR